MAFIAANPELYLGKKVGSGDCVALVQTIANAPSTAIWRPGIQVVTASSTLITKGTVIATLTDGFYPTPPSDGHAAIYLGQDHDNIYVLDQWVGQPVHYRKISYLASLIKRDDASAFFVVE